MSTSTEYIYNGIASHIARNTDNGMNVSCLSFQNELIRARCLDSCQNSSFHSLASRLVSPPASRTHIAMHWLWTLVALCGFNCDFFARCYYCRTITACGFTTRKTTDRLTDVWSCALNCKHATHSLNNNSQACRHSIKK